MKNMIGSALLCAVLVTPSSPLDGAGQGLPETLTVRDLANRPERWPASVQLTRDFDFTSGVSAKQGQSARVVEFDGRSLVLQVGDDLVFEAEVDACNLLEAANAAWKELAPAQRAVDPQALLEDASLWPEQVVCSTGFTLDGGQEIPPGTRFDLITIDSEGVVLFSTEPRATLLAELATTDVIERARERALVEPEKRPSRVAEALRGKLVDAEGEPFASESIDSARIYVLYYSASWCGPCRKFTPGFVEFVNEVGPQNPGLAVVLMSNDDEDAKLQAYMQGDEMPWPAVPIDALRKTPLLAGLAGSGIPQMVVLDRHGKVLANTFVNGQYMGPEHTLKALRKLLASGVAK